MVSNGSQRDWVGRPLARLEDRALLTGNGAFVDDLVDPGAIHAAFVRSPLAAAAIEAIDTAPALKLPGVRSVLTAADLALPGMRAVLERPEFVVTEMPLLASKTIRHVGKPLAMVLADSPYVAEDGADVVKVSYDRVSAVASIDAALGKDAPRVHECASSNVLLEHTDHGGDVEPELAGADVVIEATFNSARVSAMPLEARGCLARWDPRLQRLVVNSSTQTPHLVRTTIADLLGLPEGLEFRDLRSICRRSSLGVEDLRAPDR